MTLKMKNRTFSKISMSVAALALLAVFGLAGCGGGGGGEGGQSSSSTPTNTVNAVINQNGGAASLNDGTTVTFDSNLVKDGTAVTIITLPPEASTSTEISSLSSRVSISFPSDALMASGSLPDAGISISIPISGGVTSPVAAAVTSKSVTSYIGQSYRYVQAKLSAGTASVIFYGKVGVAATSIAAKIYQAQMVSFYKSTGAAVNNFVVETEVKLFNPNVPTAGQILKIQHIGSSGVFVTDYSFVDSFADRLLPNSGLPLGKIPLVLVHGIQLGCDGNAEAYKATWEQFITFFFSSQGQALRGKYQLYTFSYQTDQHIEDNGRLLANDLKVIFGNVPTIIVAHSMGGLVTRSAMVQHAGIGAQIGGVITLGTPHHGTKVVNGVAGAVDHYACFLATGSPGADDLAWDNFDDPSNACGNSFLCGTAVSPHVNSSGITSIGINTADTASNYTKYIPYAGVWDPSSLRCFTDLAAGVPAFIFDSTIYGMCMGASKIGAAVYPSDGMVPEVSARFTDFIGGQYLDKLQWSAKLRTYQGIHHSSIHDDTRIFTQYPNGSTGGIVQDLLDFYISLPPPATPTDTTPPSVPTGLAATAASSGQMNLSWSASTDAVGVTGYKIYRGGTYLKSASTTTSSDTGLSASTQYCYQISAYDAAGNESNKSNPDVCATTQATGSAPPAPTGVTASAGNGQATISWSSVSGATSYNVYWSTISGITKNTGTIISNVTSPYTHTGRTNGTTYYYVVTAVNGYGESAESGQVSATPQGTGTLQGVVKDAVSGSAISGVTINVYDSSNALATSKTTDSSGVYTATLTVGTYSLTIAKTGYISETVSNITIQETVATTVETVLQVSTVYSGTGNISGTIRNALNATGVSGVTLNFRSGINTMTGTIVATATTGASGTYTVSGLNTGNYTGEASISGYTTAYFTVTVIGGQTKSGQDATITPVLSAGETRIILTWGTAPSDLDSHLTGPITGSTSRFHVYFSNKGSSATSPYAGLDVDDTSSYGPETTTIYQQFTGTYRYSVHNYSNRSSTSSTILSNSSAKVKVYRGSNLVATFNVPPNMGGTLWTVFEISGDTITPVNTMSYVSSTTAVQSPAFRSSTTPVSHSDATLMMNLPMK